VLAVAALAVTACSPIYVIRAGLAEARILRARQPIPAVVLDPSTDAATRDKLTWAMEARRWAEERLGFEVGGAYGSFVQLERDTLAMVLSAAERDRLVPRTWWFPIVGRVPYRGYFSLDDALSAQRKLEAEGFDTYLRPTAAFSTLGWFDDPVLSTFLRYDDVEFVETLFHELTHAHLWVKGGVRFNESFATFVGRTAAIEFFCTREGGGPDTVKCLRAQARWRDFLRFSAFMDDLVAELEALYGDSTLTRDDKLVRREDVFAAARRRFETELQPTLEATTFQVFLSHPLNNATLLARMRYYHRLADFDRLWRARGSVRAAVAWVKEHAGEVDDPFALLDDPGALDPPPARGR